MCRGHISGFAGKKGWQLNQANQPDSANYTFAPLF
jgi:hypothetical protein